MIGLKKRTLSTKVKEEGRAGRTPQKENGEPPLLSGLESAEGLQKKKIRNGEEVTFLLGKGVVGKRIPRKKKERRSAIKDFRFVATEGGGGTVHTREKFLVRRERPSPSKKRRGCGCR